MFRFHLRTLLILMTVAPPLIAFVWFNWRLVVVASFLALLVIISLEQLARKALEGVTCPVHGTPISVRIGVDESGDQTMEFDTCCGAAAKLVEEIFDGDDDQQAANASTTLTPAPTS